LVVPVCVYPCATFVHLTSLNGTSLQGRVYSCRTLEGRGEDEVPRANNSSHVRARGQGLPKEVAFLFLGWKDVFDRCIQIPVGRTRRSPLR